MAIAFEELRPAAGRDHVAWIVGAMTGREGVALVVPDGYAAYARIHHRIHNGQGWADFAPEYLVRGNEMYDYAGSKLEFIDGDGNLDAEDVDALLPLLAAATATPNECHYALWQGWGWVHPGSMTVLSSDEYNVRVIEQAINEATAAVWAFAAACPVEPWWGGRDLILLDGSLNAVSTIGYPTFSASEMRLERQCPQWWWPDDRAWFVGTEIDDAWTYVAGDQSLIDEIRTSPQWESVVIEPTDRW